MTSRSDRSPAPWPIRRASHPPRAGHRCRAVRGEHRSHFPDCRAILRRLPHPDRGRDRLPSRLRAILVRPADQLRPTGAVPSTSSTACRTTRRQSPNYCSSTISTGCGNNLGTIVELTDDASFQTAVEALCTYMLASNDRMKVAQLWAGIEAIFDIEYELSYRLADVVRKSARHNEGPVSRSLHGYESTLRRTLENHSREAARQENDAHEAKVREHVTRMRTRLAQLLTNLIARGKVPTKDEFEDNALRESESRTIPRAARYSFSVRSSSTADPKILAHGQSRRNRLLHLECRRPDPRLVQARPLPGRDPAVHRSAAYRLRPRPDQAEGPRHVQQAQGQARQPRPAALQGVRVRVLQHVEVRLREAPRRATAARRQPAAYINGFSKNMHDVIEKFDFENTIAKLEDGQPALQGRREVRRQARSTSATFSNHEMGYVFEELIRKFNEALDENPGEHFTPREVIRLMVNLMTAHDQQGTSRRATIRTVYDPCCGSGGMLTIAKERILADQPAGRRSPFRPGGQPADFRGQQVRPVHEERRRARRREHRIRQHAVQRRPRRPHVRLSARQSALWQGLEPRSGGRSGRGGPGDEEPLRRRPAADQRRPASVPPAHARPDAPPERGHQPRQHHHERLAAVHWRRRLGRKRDPPLDPGERLPRSPVALPQQLFYNTGISTYVWVLSQQQAGRAQGQGPAYRRL